MKRYLLIFSAVFAGLIFDSCTPQIVPDPIDPRLPMYTEAGNNAAGAIVNDKVWESATHTAFLGALLEAPEFSVDSADNSVMRFQGRLADQGTYFIDFYLSGLSIHTLSDLLSLNNRIIPLDGLRNFAVIGSDYYYLSTIEEKVGARGQLYFRRVWLNPDKTEAIVSGTFGFTYLNPAGIAFEVTYGRFDFKFTGISNWYYYRANY